MSLDEKPTFNKKKSTSECSECGGNMITANSVMYCNKCGIEIANTSNATEDHYSHSLANDCNVNSKGFVAMKMVGRGAYSFNRSLLKTCASYSKYREANILKELKNWNVHAKKHIPDNVLKEACDMFVEIKRHKYVFRKDNKKGVLSACIYYACNNNKISRTPNEIAEFAGIEEKFHSFGDRILQDLNERGIIEIPAKIDPISDYVERYMLLLNIPLKYKQFAIDLIKKADKKKIHVINDSKNNTKCVGAIYMLVDRIPGLRKTITKELIDKKCGISKTTFVRYFNILCRYHKKLKNVFKRHKIPMRDEWR
jgi:hypothetical protein